MARESSRAQLRNISTIDITPLVDLTFLLLVVFLVTASVLENTVDVKPPALTATRVETEQHQIISLDRNGRLFYGEQLIARTELPGRLLELQTRSPELPIYIRADETRPYGEVMGIMRDVRQAGLSNVSLITEEDATYAQARPAGGGGR